MNKQQKLEKLFSKKLSEFILDSNKKVVSSPDKSIRSYTDFLASLIYALTDEYFIEEDINKMFKASNTLNEAVIELFLPKTKYPKNKVVYYKNNLWQSKITNNTTTPIVSNSWSKLLTVNQVVIDGTSTAYALKSTVVSSSGYGITGGGSLSSDVDISLDFLYLDERYIVPAGDVLQYYRGDKTWQTLDTSAVPENANLYYTQARFDSAFSAKTTSNLAEGTNLYYTQSRFDNAFSTKSTSDLNEGTNLYYTNARADARVNVQKGVALGLAPLNASAKIDETYLPDSILGQVHYQGTYNAATDTPALGVASTANKGHYYVVSVAGGTYSIGDWAISNGTSWEKVDNSDAVTTVFGRLGNILAIESDYSGFYPVLSGSYTNPSWISSLIWSKITNTPTTLAGYGITDSQSTLSGTGIVKSTAGSISYLTDNSVNWNTAFSWGNHASAGYVTASSVNTFTNKSGNISQWTNNTGYLTSFSETDTLASVTSRGASTSGNIVVNGQLYFTNNFGHGVIGLYSATRYQGVYAMGDSYKLSADGLTPGTLYGLAWTHSNIGGQSISGLGHQLLVMENGITQTAIGNGVWTRANITAVGVLSASNFSGSSSGTNTGDQINISGNAATVTQNSYSGAGSYEINWRSGGTTYYTPGITITPNTGTITATTFSGNATYSSYARYVYNTGSYGGTVGYIEPSSMYVVYAQMGRTVYNNGAYSGSGWVEPSDLGVRYAASAGNSSTTSQRTFDRVRTDAINRGSYGSISVSGTTGGYAGIDFTTVSTTYMVYSDGSGGLYKNNSAWTYLFDSTGNLAVGTVPWTSVTGKPSLDFATHRGEGTNYIDYAYGLYDAYRGGWRTSNDLYVAYAYSSGNSDTVDGYHASNFLGFNGTSYYQAATWIQSAAAAGLYFPNSGTGTHFCANGGVGTTSYGTFQMQGMKLGYAGLTFMGTLGTNSHEATIMYDVSGNGGHYNGTVWSYYWSVGNNCLGLASSVTTTGYSVQSNGNLRVIGYQYSNGIGYFGGDVIANYSDGRLKENVTKIKNALDKVDRLRGVYYNPNDLALEIGAATDRKKRVGVIAGDFENILPEVLSLAPFDISVNSDGEIIGSKSGQNYNTVQYEKIVPLLIEAIKELRIEVKQLRSGI